MSYTSELLRLLTAQPYDNAHHQHVTRYQAAQQYKEARAFNCMIYRAAEAKLVQGAKTGEAAAAGVLCTNSRLQTICSNACVFLQFVPGT